MLITNKELKVEFDRLSSKTITRRLVNEFKYIKSVLYISIFFGILMLLTIFTCISSSIENLIEFTPIIVTLYFIIMIYFVIQLDNKKFQQLDSNKRQFYILFLILNILKSNDNKKNYKLWSLVGCYIAELNKTLDLFRSQNIFYLCDEEYYIRSMKKSFKEKILGNVMNENFEEEIINVIQNLITINYMLNKEEYILEKNKTRSNIEKLKDDCIEKLNKVDIIEKK